MAIIIIIIIIINQSQFLRRRSAVVPGQRHQINIHDVSVPGLQNTHQPETITCRANFKRRTKIPAGVTSALLPWLCCLGCWHHVTGCEKLTSLMWWCHQQ